MADEKRLILSYKRPMDSAKRFLETRPHIRLFRGEWCDYDSGAYVPVEDAVLYRDVALFLESVWVEVKIKAQDSVSYERFAVCNAHTRGVIDCLRALTVLADAVRPDGSKSEPPFWLTGETAAPGDLIVCANGTVNTRTRELREHTSDYFS